MTNLDILTNNFDKIVELCTDENKFETISVLAGECKEAYIDLLLDEGALFEEEEIYENPHPLNITTIQPGTSSEVNDKVFKIYKENKLLGLAFFALISEVCKPGKDPYMSNGESILTYSDFYALAKISYNVGSEVLHKSIDRAEYLIYNDVEITEEVVIVNGLSKRYCFCLDRAGMLYSPGIHAENDSILMKMTGRENFLTNIKGICFHDCMEIY